MIDSVVWAQYINVTDTQTATSPQQTPRQRSMGRAAKTMPGLDIRKLDNTCALLLSLPSGSATADQRSGCGYRLTMMTRRGRQARLFCVAHSVDRHIKSRALCSVSVTVAVWFWSVATGLDLSSTADVRAMVDVGRGAAESRHITDNNVPCVDCRTDWSSSVVLLSADKRRPDQGDASLWRHTRCGH